MFVYADTINPASGEIPSIPCYLVTWYSSSWADIRITEVWFDGNDERIEITNIWNIPFSGIFQVSWAKSTLLSFTSYILPGESFLLGDSFSHLTGDHFFLTGQWLSLPDTTWFTLTLLQSGLITQQISFPKELIQSIPNNYSIEAILSWGALYRYTTYELHSNTFLTDVIANPSQVYCQNIEPELDDIFEEITTWSDTNLSTWEQEFLEEIDEPLVDENPEEEDSIPPEEAYTSWSTSWEVTEIVILYTGSSPTGIVTNTGVEHISSWNTLINSSLFPPCTISEIHSKTSPLLPEYIEIYCSRPFSWSISFGGIWAWEVIKRVSLRSKTWEYYIISSLQTGLLTHMQNILILPGISLRDDWEIISSIISGYETTEIAFPEVEDTKSYYVCTWIASGCISYATPWYDDLLLQSFIGAIQSSVPQSSPVISSPSSSSSSASNNSTYYHDLYIKWKNTAESYKKTITSLQKNATKPTTTAKKTTLVSTWSTAKKATVKSVSSTKKSTTTSKKTTVKATTWSTAKKTPTPKKTTSTTTSKKWSTISTSSAAYQLLVNEHTLYKNYSQFMDGYLRNHLYQQYNSLGLSKIDKIFKTSLSSVRKKQYIHTSTGSLSGVSVFDLQAQWYDTLQIPKVDIVYINYRRTLKSLYTLFSIPSWKKYAKR